VSSLTDGPRRYSNNKFHAVGPATQNARRPNLVRRCRGMMSWWRLTEWRSAASDDWHHPWLTNLTYSHLQGTEEPCRHRWTVTPNLNWIRWGTSSWEWSRRVKPRSNLRVPPTILELMHSAHSQRGDRRRSLITRPACRCSRQHMMTKT